MALVRLTDRERAPERRLQLWREARAAYEEGLRTSAGLDGAGAIEPADASMRERLGAGVARCDKALSAAPEGRARQGTAAGSRSRS